MSAWLYSNQQIFRDKVNERQNGQLFTAADHSVRQTFQQITPGQIFAILVIIELILVCWGNMGFDCCRSCKRKCGKQKKRYNRYHAAKSIKYLDALGEQNLLYILHEER